MLVGSGDSDTRGVLTSYSEISSKMAIKIFCSLHLWPRKYLSLQLQQRPLSWRSSISSLVNFWIFNGVEGVVGVVGVTGLGRGIKEVFQF